MNDPHLFMEGLGQASGEVVIAEATTKAAAPAMKPLKAAIKSKAVNAGTRILTRVGETTVGRTATRIATETVERAGTRLNSAVESIGQKTTALKQSVSETWQKITGSDKKVDFIETENPYNWSNKKIQSIIDEIHSAEFPEGSFKNAKYGTKNPMTITITKEGRIILSKVKGKLPETSIAKAKELLQDFDFEAVEGRGKNLDGLAGDHAEPRGMQPLGVEELKGAKQATTAYACSQCEIRQTQTGVINVTGYASQYGGKISRKKLK